MRIWFGVHLPSLPLEAFRPRWSDPGPHVVIDREMALIASTMALDAGVRPGMRRGGVMALCPQAILHERDELREQEALENVALCLLQYTPEVAAAARHSLLMDVSASLKAFGGLRKLYRLVGRGVSELGFSVRVSMAPTAQGAWLLALAAAQTSRTRRKAIRMETMTRLLDRLSMALLPSLEPYLEWLGGIGCRTLQDVRRLPRAGLKRRSKDTVLDELDRAYGQAPELFSWIAVPESFAARLELPDRIEHAESVLCGARQLILRMTAWLTTRHRAVERFVLLMEHERGRQAIPPTPLEIVLAQAASQEAHLMRLLKERLGRIELSSPVIALRLEATHTVPLAPATHSLFPDPGGTPADFKHLIELLSARLGDECVVVPALVADHRPEVCNRWLPASMVKHRSMEDLPVNDRPIWMLEKSIELILRDQRPFYGSPLRLTGTPERIECGWWDGKLVIRDYFIAYSTEPAWYWIYRERLGDEIRWYLHGLFG